MRRVTSRAAAPVANTKYGQALILDRWAGQQGCQLN